MIRLPGGGLLCETYDDLPPIPDVIGDLYADFETSSGDPRETSTNPWHHCHAIGAALSFETERSPVWFVPKELLVSGWWRDVLKNTLRWRNHNIKYDAHVSANDLGIYPKCQLICTLNSAKLIDSDRVYKGGYGLDVLSKQWLGNDISGLWHAMIPYLRGNKDFGNVPLDILADYGCQDVMTNRDLDRYVEREMPDESREVYETEKRVTSLLFEMERTGVLVDPIEVKKERLRTIIGMAKIERELEELVGRPFRPHVSGDCHDVLCNQYGLPVLAWTVPDDPTTQPSPSFDKDALKLYLTHPDAPTEVVQRIVDFKKLHTFDSLFLSKWTELQIDGVMHADFNQSVRTGRLSCSDPNLQQLDVNAKKLIIPPKGFWILCADASQIEYRFIVHYIENQSCVSAYNANPWVDFHDRTAEMVPTSRSPAKTLNFAMGYGQGKRSTVALLGLNKEFLVDVIKEVDEMGLLPAARSEMIRTLGKARAERVYDRFHHELLPELRPTAKQAEWTCRRKGYVKNHYGRRRHLPPEFARVAFNNVNQSSAGDFVKERMVALREQMPEVQQIAQVHDEIVALVPEELVAHDDGDSLMRDVVAILNEPRRPLRVPIRWSIGCSRQSWAHAKSKERERKY